MPTEKTKREEYMALQQSMAEDQEAAMLDLDAWFESEQGAEFFAKFEGYRDQTVPNSHFDQIFASFLNVTHNIKTLAASVRRAVDEQAAREAELAEQEEAAPDHPDAQEN